MQYLGVSEWPQATDGFVKAIFTRRYAGQQHRHPVTQFSDAHCTGVASEPAVGFAELVANV